ncbi:MAG: erythromycin esterase family protein [Labilithrix sp.]|nr:erythromycin esterase family protein [Labilithrix sp.]
MKERPAGDHELVAAAVPLDAGGRAYDRLLEAIGDARFVLLGEATHGTHEFYRERAILTERLISVKGFDAVAVEADWPDARRVHRFIRGQGQDASPEEAPRAFERFPTWMWQNEDSRDLVGWLRRSAPHVGFYGVDLYSLHASIDVVLGYLDRLDPAAASRARARYACFDHYGTDTVVYAYGAGLGLAPSCEEAVTQQLLDMRGLMHERARAQLERDEERDDMLFEIEMNARLIRAAEEYYRSMLRGSTLTWNLRDRHMADTLSAIAEHLDHALGRPCRIVVWEHNSHLGDARATEMASHGEVNVGQLLRERHGRDAFLVGFTTYDGLVTAAPDWGAPPARVAMRPAMAGSHELFLHFFVESIGVENVVILPDSERRLPAALRTERFERAIGVVYRPQSERISHWFRARLGDQFDAVVHMDRTRALEPLRRDGARAPTDLPDTYPSAF